jgi:mono/diheme cytochrome c family protein
MRNLRHSTLAALFASVITLAAPLSAAAAETESSMARGARLYDKWFTENKAAKPSTDHPAYIKDGKYGKDNSWRCKECHGWDYKGKDGAYSKGGHFTGVKGINGAAGKEPAVIAALLRDKNHGYTEAQLSAADANDLALFVSKGQGNLAKYLDAANKSKGDGAKGEVYYNTVCAGCHGLDGKKVKGGPPLGSVAENSAEMMHKVLNGQPGEAMPALRAIDHQIAADIAVHLNKLPK